MRQYDFTGGYASNLPPEVTPESMLLKAENVMWKGRLRKRPGWANHAINFGTKTAKGFCRAYLNTAWQNVVAFDNGTEVTFWRGATEPSAEVTHGINPRTEAVFALGTNDLWEMGRAGTEMLFMSEANAVIAVNGTDEPKVIRYTGGQYVITDLSEHDTRKWGDDQWFAGQYDDSTAEYTDDTDEAQGGGSFQVFSTANNDGCYIASNNPFNFVFIDGYTPIAAAGGIAIEYYAGDGVFTAVTPDYSRYRENHAGGADLTGTAKVDVEIHFPIPLDATTGESLWERYGDADGQVDPSDGVDTIPGGMLNQYVLRIRAGTAPTTAATAERIRIYNTQMLRHLLMGVKPQAVASHQGRLFLAAKNTFRFSPPNQITGWYAQDIEICDEGGREIIQMVSGSQFMAIIKAAAIYELRGTTTENFVLRKTALHGGVSRRGACAIAGGVAYVGRDGLRVYLDGASLRVTRHIQSDFDSWTKTDATLVDWDGNAVISFPTNGIILWADPDTLRPSESDAGEGKVSLWKWTGLKADEAHYASGDGDIGKLILHDSENDRLVIDSTNGYDVDIAAAQTDVPVDIQSQYRSQGSPGNRKVGKRIVVETSRSGAWTLTLYADNGERTAAMSFDSGSGSTHYRNDPAIPYGVDGYNMSVRLQNTTNGDVEVFGFTDERKRRAL